MQEGCKTQFKHHINRIQYTLFPEKVHLEMLKFNILQEEVVSTAT